MIGEIAEEAEAEWRSELKLPEGPYSDLHQDLMLQMVKAVSAELNEEYTETD